MTAKFPSVMILFGVFWSAMTLLFDGLTFIPTVRQVLAMNFPLTEGAILSSEVTHSSDNDGGTTHGVAVQRPLAGRF